MGADQDQRHRHWIGDRDKPSDRDGGDSIESLGQNQDKDPWLIPRRGKSQGPVLKERLRQKQAHGLNVTLWKAEASSVVLGKTKMFKTDAEKFAEDEQNDEMEQCYVYLYEPCIK